MQLTNISIPLVLYYKKNYRKQCIKTQSVLEKHPLSTLPEIDKQGSYFSPSATTYLHTPYGMRVDNP